jgi:hypothetical protein
MRPGPAAAARSGTSWPVLAQPLGRDRERVEQATLAVIAGQLDHVHAAGELGHGLEVVVRLGVDVDRDRR